MMGVWQRVSIMLTLALLPLAAGHGAISHPKPRNDASDGSSQQSYGMRFHAESFDRIKVTTYSAGDLKCGGGFSPPTNFTWLSGACLPTGKRESILVSFSLPKNPGQVVDCTINNDCRSSLDTLNLAFTRRTPCQKASDTHHHADGHDHHELHRGFQSTDGEAPSVVYFSVYTDFYCGKTSEVTLKLNLDKCTPMPPQDDTISTGCAGDACMWFSQGCTIGCDKCTAAYNEKKDVGNFVGSLCGSTKKPTIMDPALRTYNPQGTGDKTHVGDWTAAHPWRAPGNAPVMDACGMAGGSDKDNSLAGGFAPPGHKVGDRGSKLPIVNKTAWVAGSVVEVSWGIAANHGGGYQYRLCPAGEQLTEECFQRTPLSFAGKTHKLRFGNGTDPKDVEIPATHVTEGVEPAGSMWAKVPIPACDDASGGFQEKGCTKPQFAPPPGCDETCWGYQNNPAVKRYMPDIVDRLQLPSGLTGDYVLGLRWDCEGTAQVWASCSDITITPASADVYV